MNATNKKFEFAGLLLIVLFNLYLIWGFAYYVGSDGSSHIENAANIIHLLKNDCANITRLFHFTEAPVPNWITHLIAMPLLQVFDPVISEKIIISIIIISFSAGLYRLLRAVATNTYFIFLLLLFVPNAMLSGGGYNFMFGLTLYLFALTWWIKYGNVHNKRNFIKTTALLITLYFFHIFGLGAFCVSVAALEFEKLLREKNITAFLKRSIYYVCAALPVVFMFLIYLTLPKNKVEGVVGFYNRFSHLVFPASLYTISQNDYWVVMLGGIFIWGLVLIALWSKLLHKNQEQNPKQNSMLWVTIFFALAMMFTPATFAGGWVIEPRIELCFFISLILWLATNHFSAPLKYFIITASIFLNIFCLYNKVVMMPVYNEVINTIDDANKRIPANSNVFAVNISPLTVNYNTGEVNYRAAIPDVTGYITARGQCVAEVANYHEGEKNVFPVSYRDEVNQHITLGHFRTINSLMIVPPIVNIANYEKTTGIKIDYISIAGKRENMYHYKPDEKFDENELYNNFMAEVNKGFSLFYESPNHIVRIYKAKPSQQ